jgi:hypothetical protein
MRRGNCFSPVADLCAAGIQLEALISSVKEQELLKQNAPVT